MAILHNYEDDKEHIHVLSYGGGTQSTALLLMALKGEINGVIPDYIIFADTGWEPKSIYDWIDKVNNYIKQKYNREIIFCNNGNLREDTIRAIQNNTRFAGMPFYTQSEDGTIGMSRRGCTEEYKIVPIKKKIRELLGYEHRKRMLKHVVHLWKGISTDEIQRVKPTKDKWLIAEHPLIENVSIDRSGCIAYVEREGLGTPAKSSCIGCPFHDFTAWRELKLNDKESWDDAVLMDKIIRDAPQYREKLFLHRSGMPLEEVDLMEDQLDLDFFINECEGMCGI